MSITSKHLDRIEEQLLARHERAPVDLTRYRGRIEAFAEEVLHVPFLTDTQRLHLRAVMTSRRVAAYGANGCGKSFDDAIVALYFIYVENTLVIATSAKEAQLRDQYMRDVRRLFMQAESLDGELYAMQLRRPGAPDTGLYCMAASSADNLRSYHAPRVLVQLQEAQGLPDFAFESAEMMAIGSDDRITLTGNSSAPGGAFHKRCLSAQWAAVRFNAMEHDNVASGIVWVQGGPTRESIEHRRAEYGETSAFFISSVLGDWPAEGSIDSLFLREWLEAAFAAHEASDGMLRPEPRPVVALDVARSLARDQSVAAVVQGNRVHQMTAWHSRDLVATTDKVMEIAEQARADWVCAAIGLPPGASLNEWHVSVPRLALHIDAPSVGSGVVDIVRSRGRACFEYWGWNSAIDPKRYSNVRAENYWHLRTLLEKGKVALPRDAMLLEEALAYTYSHDAKQRVQLISKEDLRKSLGKSSDRLDACVIGLAATSGRGAWSQVQLIW